MSDQKHNNPLSPEELFRLLDKKANTGLNELDEFEQDALDGFANLGNIEQSRKLIDQMNTAISKKVSDSDNKGTQKNRFIWFSAAASIILIVMISIFYFKQTKQDSSKELALNDMIKKEEQVSPDVQASGESAPIPAEAVNTGVKANESNVPALARTIPSEKKTPETQGITTNQSPLIESAVSYGAGKEAKDEEKSGEQNNRVVLDETTEKNTAAPADKLEVSKKSEIIKEEKELAQGYSMAQNEAKSQTEADDKKELRKEDSPNADKAYKSKSNSNEAVVRTKSISSASSSAPAAGNVSNSESAYYSGGELAIKNFVLDYMKSRQYKTTIAGTYKIKATVSEAGHLNINSIVQTTTEICNCTDKITEALNTMTKWNSSMNDRKKISSQVEFMIKF